MVIGGKETWLDVTTHKTSVAIRWYVDFVGCLPKYTAEKRCVVTVKCVVTAKRGPPKETNTRRHSVYLWMVIGGKETWLDVTTHKTSVAIRWIID